MAGGAAARPPRTEAGAQRKAEPFRRRRTMEKTMRKMKDSGVEWIGEIPEDWEVFPLFALFKEKRCKNIGLKEKNVLSLSYGKIIRRNIENNYGLLPKSFETYNVVNKLNIVLRLTDLQNDKTSLRVGLVTETGIITSAYITLENKINLDSRFFYFLLYSYDVLKVIYNMGNGVRQNLKFIELSRISLLFPPLPEQQRIADYLDDKCGQLDSCMELTRRSMEKLREYKNSLIAEAVTRGLDPDVPMKDSGIPWIGKIPEDWDIIKLSYGVSSFGSGTTPASENESFYDGNILWVTTSELRENVIYDTKKHISDLALDKFSALKLFHEGSLVVAMYGATIGRMAFLGKKATTNQACCVIYGEVYIILRYLYYFILAYKENIISLSQGSGQPNLSQDIIKNIRITMPLKDEQQRIADYLDKKCAHIDALLEQKQKLLDKLADYKKSLIFECVTGKREVTA